MLSLLSESSVLGCCCVFLNTHVDVSFPTMLFFPPSQERCERRNEREEVERRPPIYKTFCIPMIKKRWKKKAAKAFCHNIISKRSLNIVSFWFYLFTIDCHMTWWWHSPDSLLMPFWRSQFDTSEHFNTLWEGCVCLTRIGAWLLIWRLNHLENVGW